MGDDSPENGSKNSVSIGRDVRFSSGGVERTNVEGMRSGKATNFTILRPQVSMQSSDRPTHVRSGERTLTSPDVGE
jgi:hypothetical protein